MSDCTFQLKVLLCVLKILKVVIRRYFDPHGDLTWEPNVRFSVFYKVVFKVKSTYVNKIGEFVFSQVCVCTLATIGANLGFILVQM